MILTPSQCQIEVDPLFVIDSKHSHQKDVNEDSFTQCPGEGGQEEVVQQGCHKLTGTLAWRKIKHNTLQLNHHARSCIITIICIMQCHAGVVYYAFYVVHCAHAATARK